MIFSKKQIKQIVVLAIPVSIGQLGHIMMGVIDSIMVGKVGAESLAASSLANGLFFLFAVIGIGLTSAITPLVAIASGRKNYDECGTILREGFVVTFLFSIVLMLIVYFGADLIRYMGQPERVTILTISYLEILSFSIIPMMLFQNHRMYLEGLSFVKPPMIVAVVANIANVFFNWVFIFGNLGAPELGLDGAGWSTFYTRVAMAVFLIAYVHKSSANKSYLQSLGSKKVDYLVAKKIIAIGLPSGFQYFFEVAAFAFAAILIGWLGTVQLAAHQIALNLASVTYMIILGISAAGTIKVAEGVGKKDIATTRVAGFSTLHVGAATMFVSAIVFFLFNDWLPTLYIADYEVIKLASSLLIIAGFFQIFDGLQACGLGILRGLKDVKIPLLVTFASYWIIGIPVGYVLGFKFNMGAIGVWIGLLLGLFFVALMLVVRFNNKSKKMIQ